MDRTADRSPGSWVKTGFRSFTERDTVVVMAEVLVEGASIRGTIRGLRYEGWSTHQLAHLLERFSPVQDLHAVSMCGMFVIIIWHKCVKYEYIFYVYIYIYASIHIYMHWYILIHWYIYICIDTVLDYIIYIYNIYIDSSSSVLWACCAKVWF